MRVLPSLFLLLPGAAALVSGAHPAPDDEYVETILPLVSHYCGDCHGGPEPEADLDLGAYPDADSARADPYVWELVRERVALREMPPAVLPQPDEDERARLLGWIDARFGAAEVDRTPGRTVLRRLNRFEVQNALWDVLGIRVETDELLPLDEAADGFDVVGSGLSFSDAHLDGLLALAEEAALRAVPWIDPERGLERTFRAEDFEVEERLRSRGTLRFYVNGEAVRAVDVEHAGPYELVVHARASRAGDELAKLRVRVGDETAAVVEVEHDGDDFAPHVVPLELAVGSQRLGVAFVNDHYEPDHPEPRLRDRNLIVERAVLRGPLGVALPTEGLAAEAQADLVAVTTRLVAGLWRRTPSANEVGRLLALEPEGTAAPLALRTALIGALVSPRFLYRLEPHADGGDASRPLDGTELASRLATFLWSSVPDAELRERAASGALDGPEGLAHEARRMLRDARASRLFEGFATQWLQLRPLRMHAPDPKRFAVFDDDLRASMLAETELLFEAVLREDRPLADLVAPAFTFLDERLATHYGIEGVTGERMRRVPLRDAARGGLLAQASVLTATSFPTRTSPVLRGKWLLEVLFGDAPPPPPPDVPALESKAERGDPRDLRALLERHRADPACSACHAAMDPLGFGLEAYDAVGRWRDPAETPGLDTRGELPDGRAFDGPADLKALVAADPRFVRNLVERLLVYALGRSLAPGDRTEADAIAGRLSAAEDSLADVIEAVVRSEAFRTRGPEPVGLDRGPASSEANRR